MGVEYELICDETRERYGLDKGSWYDVFSQKPQPLPVRCVLAKKILDSFTSCWKDEGDEEAAAYADWLAGDLIAWAKGNPVRCVDDVWDEDWQRKDGYRLTRDRFANVPELAALPRCEVCGSNAECVENGFCCLCRDELESP